MNFQFYPLKFDRFSRNRAFSLLELTGVLAIIAILAALSVPVIIKRIDRAVWIKENANLSALGDALTQYVLRSNTIPNLDTWGDALSTQLGLASTDITRNTRKYNRAYVYENGGWLVTNSTYNAGLGLLYQQFTNGTASAPIGAKVMIISTLARTNPISSGQLDAVSFSNIWNAAQGTLPVGSVWTNWKGKGEDLLIQRINVEPLFHRVVLVNNDIGSTPWFRINGSKYQAAVPSGSGYNAYYIAGTMLGLCDTNGSPSPSPLILAQEVVRQDISRIFENGYWRDEIGIGAHTNGLSDFTKIAAIFFNSPAPGIAARSPTPRGVANILSSYMYAYAGWGNESPCFSYNGSIGNSSQALEYQLMQMVLGCFTAVKNGGNTVNGGGVLVP